jgi:hypothetical protein
MTTCYIEYSDLFTMTNDIAIDNNNDSPLISKTYRGPVKLVWENGEQVLRPDFEAAVNGTPGDLELSYSVAKNLDDTSVISETDIKQFESLKSDEAKYNMVKGMITGVERVKDPPFHIGSYVDGEYRSLKTILKDLIEQKKIWLDPKTGNIFEFGYAIENHLISYKCMYCSQVLFSNDMKSKHEVSTHMSQRRAY